MTNQPITKNRTSVYLSYLQTGIDKIFRGNHTMAHNTERVTIAPETILYHLDNLFDDARKRVQVRNRMGLECGYKDAQECIIDFIVNILTDEELPELRNDFFNDARVKLLLTEDDDEYLFSKQ